MEATGIWLKIRDTQPTDQHKLMRFSLFKIVCRFFFSAKLLIWIEKKARAKKGRLDSVVGFPFLMNFFSKKTCLRSGAGQKMWRILVLVFHWKKNFFLKEKRIYLENQDKECWLVRKKYCNIFIKNKYNKHSIKDKQCLLNTSEWNQVPGEMTFFFIVHLHLWIVSIVSRRSSFAYLKQR